MVDLVKSDYVVFTRLVGSFRSQHVRSEVEQLLSQAMGYVWGWQDARGERDTSVSWDFGYFYGRLAAEYAKEWRCSRPAIYRAFEEWRSERAEVAA